MAQTRSYVTKQKGKTEVDPFWNIDDLLNIIKWFKDKGDYDSYLITMFCLLMGRKIGDTVSMKWLDFYDDNGNQREEYSSGKESIVICPAVSDAIDYYLEMTNRNPKMEYGDYIFNIAFKTQWIKRKGNAIYATNDLDIWCEWLNKDFSDKRKEKIINDFKKQNVYHSLGEYLYYEVEWNDIVKWQTDVYRRRFHKAVKEINVPYNVSTHSLRKTFGYISVMVHPKDIDSLEILQSIFQHSNIQQTREYIGLGDERKRQYYLDMGEVIHFLENRGSYLNKEENDPAYVSIKYDELKRILVDVINEYAPNRIDIIDRFLYLLDEHLGKSTTNIYIQNTLQENITQIENCENLIDELMIEHISDRDDVKFLVNRKYSNDSSMQERMMKFYDMGMVEDFLDLDTIDDEIIAHAAMEVEAICNVSLEEAKVIVIEWIKLMGI